MTKLKKRLLAARRKDDLVRGLVDSGFVKSPAQARKFAEKTEEEFKETLNKPKRAFMKKMNLNEKRKHEHLVLAILHQGFATNETEASLIALSTPKKIKEITKKTPSQLYNPEIKKRNYGRLREASFSSKEARRLMNKSPAEVDFAIKVAPFEDGMKKLDKKREFDLESRRERAKEWGRLSAEKELPESIKEAAEAINGIMGLNGNHSYGFMIVHKFITEGKQIREAMKESKPDKKIADVYHSIRMMLSGKDKKEYENYIDGLFNLEIPIPQTARVARSKPDRRVKTSPRMIQLLDKLRLKDYN